MSIVSSYFSSRSTAFGINAQVASLMDSIFAIGFGLAVRFVIDLVSHHDLKLTGTLVGLWEGVVMQHFLRKMPSSFDPYVAYGVRLFIDFLFTESVARLVLVLVWSGMGMVLADIAPALWVDVGMRRIWRRFRRDLYVMSQSVPAVPLFDRPRIVRFSPSRTASVVSTTPPSVVTNTTRDPNLLSPPNPAPRKRPVPGAFPDDISETETTISLQSDTSTTPGTMHHRFSTFKRYQPSFETESEISSGFNDLDAGNVSSSESSTSTQTADPSFANPSEIPDYEEEQEIEIREKGKGKKREESDRDITPKLRDIVLPPTPSDSVFPRDHNDPDEVQPPSAEVPTIPDHTDDDWENIDRNEATPTPSPIIPPTPPAKDNIPSKSRSLSPTRQQQQVPQSEHFPSTEREQQTRENEAAFTSTERPSANLLDFDTEVTQQPQHTEVPVTSSFQPSVNPPAEQPTSKSHENILNTREDTRTPPPPFQSIYDQPLSTSEPTSQPAPPENTLPESTIPQGQSDTNNSANNNATNERPDEANKNETNDTNNAATQHTETEQQTQGPTTSAPAETLSTEDLAATAPPAQAETSHPPTPPSPASSSGGTVLAETSGGRLQQALKLRKETSEQDRKITELKRQRDAAKADGPEGADIISQRTIAIKAAEKELAKLHRKAERWLLSAYNSKENPPTEVRLAGLELKAALDKVEEVICPLVLKNEPSLAIIVAKSKRVNVTTLLDSYNLEYKIPEKVSEPIIVSLPTSVKTDA